MMYKRMEDMKRKDESVLWIKGNKRGSKGVGTGKPIMERKEKNMVFIQSFIVWQLDVSGIYKRRAREAPAQ